MLEPFIGMIAVFGFNFAPRGWAFCNGQLLPISQNDALFSLLGTTFGGDGRTNFALPDLRGRVPIHFGDGSGLSPYTLGSRGGSERVALSSAELPAHNHDVRAANGAATGSRPGGNVLAGGGSYATTPDTTMSADMIASAGGGQPHENVQPFLTLNFCIALQGIYPSRS